MPGNDFCSEFFFDILYAVGKSRLRDKQPFGRLRQVFFLGDDFDYKPVFIIDFSSLLILEIRKNY